MAREITDPEFIEALGYALPIGDTERLNDVFARYDGMRVALERIAEQQQKTLETIRANEFVFTDIGHEPGNWQHLAFTIYTDLCEIDSIARAALPDCGQVVT